MIAVIFEVTPKDGQTDAYLDLAAEMRPLAESVDGFISVERFQSLTTPGKLLSLSFWRDEESLETWRNLPAHRKAQCAGRSRFFQDYRLRIAGVIRDYGISDRDEAPADSRAVHDT